MRFRIAKVFEEFVYPYSSCASLPSSLVFTSSINHPSEEAEPAATRHAVSASDSILPPAEASDDPRSSSTSFHVSIVLMLSSIMEFIKVPRAYV